MKIGYFLSCEEFGPAELVAQAHQQRQAEADQARAVALMRRQLVGQDGNEDQVVDTQHDLEDDQGQQTEPDGGVEEQFHQGLTLM